MLFPPENQHLKNHKVLSHMQNHAHPVHFAQATPEKPAVIFADSGDCLTYGALCDNAARAATVYREFGLRDGDVVAVLMENQLRFPEVVWAAKNSGLRYVPISTHLNAADAGYIIEDSGAKLCVTSTQYADLARDAIASVDTNTPVLVAGDFTGDGGAYDMLIDLAEPLNIRGMKRGASMLYSSGTTGRPKGVKIRIADVGPESPPQRFHMLMEQFGFDENSVFISPGPFYHAAPLRFMMTVHRTGGTVVAFHKFDAASVLKAVEQFGGTHGFFVPTMFRRMLKLQSKDRAAFDLSSMQHAIHAAAPCPPDVKRAMIGWWGPVIDELYSGTESVGHTFISSAEWLSHPGSVGKPSANCQVRIVDDQRRVLPPDVPGRIEMSNGLAVEYHGKAANIPLYSDDGYASLGDVGYLDDDGYLYLTDRESDMIISGGVNIYPQEAERVLMEHPDVEDVAVFGAPHDDMGQEVRAMIQLSNPAEATHAKSDEIIAFCRVYLSKIKCPSIISFVSQLPRNELGKLAKHRLDDSKNGSASA
jgi:acyl-CoA synthetase (AMP-forming)/AMP-acid ligase II